MATGNMHVYQRLAEAKGLTINGLETALSLSNGAIRKAIERRSRVSTENAEKIVSMWPEISLDCLLKGELKGSTPALEDDGETYRSTKTQKPAESEDWQAKYYASLERDNAALLRAQDAIIAMAESKADKADIAALSARLDQLITAQATPPQEASGPKAPKHRLGPQPQDLTPELMRQAEKYFSDVERKILGVLTLHQRDTQSLVELIAPLLGRPADEVLDSLHNVPAPEKSQQHHT